MIKLIFEQNCPKICPSCKIPKKDLKIHFNNPFIIKMNVCVSKEGFNLNTHESKKPNINLKIKFLLFWNF